MHVFYVRCKIYVSKIHNNHCKTRKCPHIFYCIFAMSNFVWPCKLSFSLRELIVSAQLFGLFGCMVKVLFPMLNSIIKPLLLTMSHSLNCYLIFCLLFPRCVQIKTTFISCTSKEKEEVFDFFAGLSAIWARWRWFEFMLIFK